MVWTIAWTVCCMTLRIAWLVKGGRPGRVGGAWRCICIFGLESWDCLFSVFWVSVNVAWAWSDRSWNCRYIERGVCLRAVFSDEWFSARESRIQDWSHSIALVSFWLSQCMSPLTRSLPQQAIIGAIQCAQSKAWTMRRHSGSTALELRIERVLPMGLSGSARYKVKQ